MKLIFDLTDLRAIPSALPPPPPGTPPSTAIADAIGKISNLSGTGISFRYGNLPVSIVPVADSSK